MSSSFPETDPVNRLYLAAESLTFLASGLPEESGGFANLLSTLAHTITACTDEISDTECECACETAPTQAQGARHEP